ncbi:hypothetical protein ACO9S2_15890 [Nitrospira sp. NS4]|uniref:hypothetical protein n=1 Tax=Nitrospira sp. NS4 TaxID=3414498 RepID=UPI003C2C3716
MALLRTLVTNVLSSSRQFHHGHTLRIITICVTVTCIIGLIAWPLLVNRTYTSRDLTSLSCEGRDRFFLPIEFNDVGGFLYQDQQTEFEQRLRADKSLKDVYIFLHGWDKTAHTAERDYQDFICRFYISGKRSQSGAVKPRAEMDNAIMVGLFWPSTIFPSISDPDLLKPFSYPVIRHRADHLEQEGMQAILRTIYEVAITRKQDAPIRLHLIGHSFGGRILVKALLRIAATGESKQKFFESFDGINLVLLLPAVSPRDVTSNNVLVRQFTVVLKEPLFSTGGNSANDEPRPALDLSLPGLQIYVVHSSNDWANRFLFPLGALYGADPAVCSIGACGLPFAPRVEVDEGGALPNEATIENTRYLNVWNIDASKILSSHTDIYKGRVANLLWQLVSKHDRWKVTTTKPSIIGGPRQ